MTTIGIVEPCGNTGLGAAVLARVVREQGADVLQVAPTSPQLDLPFDTGKPSVRAWYRPDVWFVSITTWRQFEDVPRLLESLGLSVFASDRSAKDPCVVFGGQAMRNPRPVSPFADVCVYGDAEAVAVPIVRAAQAGASKREIVSSAPSVGEYIVDASADIGRLYMHGHRRTVEVARGCRMKCAFCAVGDGAYREAAKETVLKSMREASTMGKRINLFAPSFASCRHAETYIGEALRLGLSIANCESTAAHAIRWLRRGPLHSSSLHVGIEGTSERIRKEVGKPISDASILELASLCEARKVKRIKLYMIPGLPGETDEDRSGFSDLLTRFASEYHGMIDVTASLFQPIPGTRLEHASGEFPQRAWEWVMAEREKRRTDYVATGRRVIWSRPKGKELHDRDVWLSRADESAADVLAGRSRLAA